MIWNLTRVKLYEQSRFANEVGAAVHLAPNSNGILRKWGIFAEEFGGNEMKYVVEFTGEGKLMRKVDLREPNKAWQHQWLLCHRVSLHDKLKKVATSEEGEGVPAKLHTASKVVEIDPEKGTITLENGETSTADIIVGADGVYVCRSTDEICSRLALTQETVSDEEVHQGSEAIQLRKGCFPLPHPALRRRGRPGHGAARRGQGRSLDVVLGRQADSHVPL